MSYRLEQQIKGLRGALTKAAPLAKLTWLRVGGIADWLFTPADADDLQNFLRQCPSDIPVMPLGAGSNTLVRDGGVEGVVIHLAKNINALSHTTGELRAEAGCSDAEVARYAAKAGLTGLEFMVTIPGTIGGGLIMNAGCYGKEFKDVLIRAEGFQRDGTPFSITPVDIEMRYRNTSVPEGWIFTAAHFEVANSAGEDIRGRMKEMIAARADSQPVGVRTGGSTFANPDGTKAWQIIDAAGCRGLQRGDASISEKHCNFLINKGNASADDLEQLGEQVRDAVESNSGIRLRWEIKRIGRKGGTNASI
jgi:UDP-N-acetylmuramate dehydrogenase